MDLSIVISAISTIIACGALLVSIRTYKLSENSRRNDKLLELRIGVVELKRKAINLTRDFEVKARGDSSEFTQEITHNLDILFRVLSSIDEFMNSNLDHLTESKIDSASIKYHEAKSIIESLNKTINQNANGGGGI